MSTLNDQFRLSLKPWFIPPWNPLIRKETEKKRSAATAAAV
jgi:hypothetical protein